MKVENILQAKGADVFSVRGDQKISDAVALLNEKNIGAVIVKDNAEKVIGILSERDVVRRIGADGAGMLNSPISSCMTPDPVTCGLGTSINELMGQMTRRRIRHMPVVEAGKLVGLVSIGDVVKRKIDVAEQEAAALKEYIAS